MSDRPAKKWNDEKPTAFDSLIGSGFELVGDIVFSGSLRIDGKVNGNVAGRNAENCELMLGEHGEVQGDVSVTHAIVNGTITGNIHCAESVELQPHAEIVGNVHYKAIAISPGAVVRGKLICASGRDNGVVNQLKPDARPRD
jgi:cytoskeletal protein CcmA (bactofilin family)